MIIKTKEDIAYGCDLFLFIIHKLSAAYEKQRIKPLLKYGTLLLCKSKCIEPQIQYYCLMIYDWIKILYYKLSKYNRANIRKTLRRL